MRKITFNLSTLHEHGDAWHQFLCLRKRFFVDQMGWDIPNDGQAEMDQYDTPQAHYSLVLDDLGRVIGGARIAPTTARWGASTYMLRDALEGSLDAIPSGALPHLIEDDGVWECTRLVIAHEVATQEDRTEALLLIVSGLVEIAQANGGHQLISLSPLPLMRALRQLGFGATRLGTPYTSAEDGRKYAVLAMPAIPSARLSQSGRAIAAE
ncbi:MAG: acyl-homoserine-lactone synthase [Pseudomonadota bacterium]